MILHYISNFCDGGIIEQIYWSFISELEYYPFTNNITFQKQLLDDSTPLQEKFNLSILNRYISGLHKLEFFLHKILWTQNCFRCTSVHVGNYTCKKLTCILLIITWCRGRKCTRFVLKHFEDKNGFSFSVLCTAPFLQIILFQLTWWLHSILVQYAIYLHSNTTIFDKLKWNKM